MNKTILITGCSSGIGLYTAQHLHSLGYQVFSTARNSADVEKLKNLGLNSFQLDLNDSLSIKNAVLKIMDVTGGELYALFNNAAYGLPGAVEDLSRDALREQFETNLFGTMELTNLILPIMRKQGYGRIIQNSSILGFAAMSYRGAYNSSKFALEGISDTLRQELDGTEIYVSIIEPGPIISDFRKNALRAYKKYINAEKSIHKAQYDSMLERLNMEGPAAPFTLGPDAVCEKVIDALEAKTPKIRYYVTKPTYIMGYLKRILSSRLMDRVLIKAGGGGRR